MAQEPDYSQTGYKGRAYNATSRLTPSQAETERFEHVTEKQLLGAALTQLRWLWWTMLAVIAVQAAAAVFIVVQLAGDSGGF